jgi:hypothetical protein
LVLPLLANPEYFLKEEIVGHHQRRTALLAQHGEHHRAIGYASLQLLWQQRNDLTQVESPPQGQEQAVLCSSRHQRAEGPKPR